MIKYLDKFKFMHDAHPALPKMPVHCALSKIALPEVILTKWQWKLDENACTIYFRFLYHSENVNAGSTPGGWWRQP